jgi:cytochrome P450
MFDGSSDADTAAPLTCPFVQSPGPYDEPQVRAYRYPDGRDGWLVTGFSAARKVFRDPRFGVRPVRFPFDDRGALAAKAGPEEAGDLLRLDPPEHTSLRKILAPYFTKERAIQRRPAIKRIVALCLDAMEEAGPSVDFVQSFALPVPSMVTCETMGIPFAERGRFEHAAAVWLDFFGTSVEEKKATLREFFDWTRAVIVQKRVQPENDLLSELTLTTELDNDTLAGLAFLLFQAGHETTALQLVLSISFLLSDRQRWEGVCSGSVPIEQVVEELLRYLNISSLDFLTRTAQEDVELDGVLIRAGESVMLQSPAPSGDPEKFDDLDQFVPSREMAGHLVFGFGRHTCLGQHLARVELRIALEALAQRFPSLRMEKPLPAKGSWVDLFTTGLHEELLVAW